jgi:hypothetical protein
LGEDFFGALCARFTARFAFGFFALYFLPGFGRYFAAITSPPPFRAL